VSQSFFHRQFKECLCNGKLQINLILGETNIGEIKEAYSVLVFVLWRMKPREIPKSCTHSLNCCVSRSLPPGRSYSERSMVTTFAYFTSNRVKLRDSLTTVLFLTWTSRLWWMFILRQRNLKARLRIQAVHLQRHYLSMNKEHRKIEEVDSAIALNNPINCHQINTP
jgi:hypothetical protein